MSWILSLKQSFGWRGELDTVFKTVTVITQVVAFVKVYIRIMRWRSWLGHCATRQVAALIPDGVILLSSFSNPEDHTAHNRN